MSIGLVWVNTYLLGKKRKKICEFLQDNIQMGGVMGMELNYLHDRILEFGAGGRSIEYFRTWIG